MSILRCAICLQARNDVLEEGTACAICKLTHEITTAGEGLLDPDPLDAQALDHAVELLEHALRLLRDRHGQRSAGNAATSRHEDRTGDAATSRHEGREAAGEDAVPSRHEEDEEREGRHIRNSTFDLYSYLNVYVHSYL